MRRSRKSFDAIAISPSASGFKFIFIIVTLFALINTFTHNGDSKSTILMAQAVTTGPTTYPSVRPTARPSVSTSSPTKSPTTSPTKLPTLDPSSISGPFSVENIVMTLNGLSPLTPEDEEIFETTIESYIKDYYSDPNSNCNNCLQKDIDIVDVSITVTKQNPRYVASDSRRQLSSSARLNNHRYRYLQTSGPTQISLTYTQTTTYRQINPIDATITDIVKDIVKEPFNNVNKRGRVSNLLKNAGEAFKSLTLVLAPTIQEPSSILGIGVIAAMASGGLVILVLVVFLICKCSRRSGGKSNYGYDDDHPVSTKSRRPNGHPSNANHARHPSQVEVQDLKDEVSTMVDPTPQYGVFNEGKSFTGYAPSIASYDPDYNGIYNGGGTDDPSLVSSAGGTLGSQTQKSKFSAMGSTFTPAQTLGPQSIFTDDDQSFEQHLQNRRNGRQREQYFDIYAPGGKLGVVIDTPNSGAPVVHNIKDTCPIADQLRIGDKLIAVDDEDVRSMTAVKVSKLISQKSNNPTRKFTIARVVDESSP